MAIITESVARTILALLPSGTANRHRSFFENGGVSYVNTVQSDLLTPRPVQTTMGAWFAEGQYLLSYYYQVCKRAHERRRWKVTCLYQFDDKGRLLRFGSRSAARVAPRVQLIRYDNRSWFDISRLQLQRICRRMRAWARNRRRVREWLFRSRLLCVDLTRVVASYY